MVVLVRTPALVIGADLSSVTAAVEALAQDEVRQDSCTESSRVDFDSVPATGKKLSRRQHKRKTEELPRAAAHPEDTAQAARDEQVISKKFRSGCEEITEPTRQGGQK